MSGRRGTGPMPEDHDAIRVHVDPDEPPALVFNENALPGALVSWAWSQLSALDSLLRVVSARHQSNDDGDADVIGAVHCVLVPVLNALAFSERRAYQLQTARAAPHGRKRKRRERRASAGG